MPMTTALPGDQKPGDSARNLTVEERIRLIRAETFFGHAVGNMVGILLGGGIFCAVLLSAGVSNGGKVPTRFALTQAAAVKIVAFSKSPLAAVVFDYMDTVAALTTPYLLRAAQGDAK